MKRGSRQAATLVSLIVPATLALWCAHYLIETFLPGVTPVDLGAFCGMGVGVRPGDRHLAEFLRDH